ncbi:MAG TPA: phytanoyl-CoA dioxygenase family protein [Limnobacter sp.]
MNSLACRLQELKDKGFILIEDALPTEYCESIASFIDAHLDEQGGEHESGHVGTMQRIWSAEKFSGIVLDYKDKCSRILSTLFGQPLQPQRILAMRDKAIPFKTQEERDRFAKGRWHYDSWTDQYKIFLFLKDVGPDNGPFEFIPGTNGTFKRKLAFTRPWWLFNPFTHFTSTKRPYQSIADERVQSIIERGYPSFPLVARQGTMLIVNPSALIHRASPINSGSRYLSVAYF